MVALLAHCSGEGSPATTGPEVTSKMGVATGPATHPNIVFVLTDDLSWDLISHMPSVLAMQKEGLTFSSYFVTDSLCCPSRSSIFTGKYPHDTHVFTNAPPYGGYGEFEAHHNQSETFAVALSQAHYRTGMLGKYLNRYDPIHDHPDPGWSDWAVPGGAYPEYDYDLNQNGQAVHYGDAPEDYLTDVLSGLADKYVESSPGPFLLEIATFAPHEPYVPAPRYIGKLHAKAPRTPAFGTANANPPKWLAAWPTLSTDDITTIDTDYNLRVEAVQAVDDLIDSLRQTLARTGADKDTYLVFSSDNGYHMGEHELMPGKQTAFDTDIRVPLIVVGPGVPAGVVDDHIAMNIDLCPTFAELAGTPAPPTADGHSLVSLLHGDKVDRWRSVALVEHVGPDVAPMDPTDPDNELTNGPNPTTYNALRTASSVFVQYNDGETEYYDHASDPYEQTNSIATLGASQRQSFEAKIDSIKNCHSSAQCWEAQK
jgi:N-acetylglucosamine-6-sulfatase